MRGETRKVVDERLRVGVGGGDMTEVRGERWVFHVG